MKLSWLVAVIYSLLLSIPNCKAGAPQSNYGYYFTWTNYSAGDSKDNAVYLWKGRIVGTGRKGFREILKQLDGLPDKVTVYVFPRLAKSRYEGSPGFIEDLYPFSDDWEEFDNIWRRKMIDIVYCYQDEKGRPVKGL